EYLEKVAKHQRYLADEKRSDPDSPTLKPAKATKKSKPSAPKVNLRPPVTKPASSQQPEPKPTPAKSQGKKLEESLNSVYDVPRGPLPPVVIREPESRKYQLLPEVQGKGKEKVTDNEVEFDEDVPGIDAGVPDEAQAGPNPGEQDEGHARLNPDDVAAVTATTYPNVQENLKLTVEEQVILEEPASSTRTLSSLQHLAKDLSYGDLFFNDKPSKADNEKTTA
nr:hypothetical protein [Tanacetum cinerariifolium]